MKEARTTRLAIASWAYCSARRRGDVVAVKVSGIRISKADTVFDVV